MKFLALFFSILIVCGCLAQPPTPIGPFILSPANGSATGNLQNNALTNGGTIATTANGSVTASNLITTNLNGVAVANLTNWAGLSTNIFITTNGQNIVTQYLITGIGIALTQNGPTNIVALATNGLFNFTNYFSPGANIAMSFTGPTNTISAVGGAGSAYHQFQFFTNAGGQVSIISGALTTNLQANTLTNTVSLWVTNSTLTVTNSTGSVVITNGNITQSGNHNVGGTFTATNSQLSGATLTGTSAITNASGNTLVDKTVTNALSLAAQFGESKQTLSNLQSLITFNTVGVTNTPFALFTNTDGSINVTSNGFAVAWTNGATFLISNGIVYHSTNVFIGQTNYVNYLWASNSPVTAGGGITVNPGANGTWVIAQSGSGSPQTWSLQIGTNASGVSMITNGVTLTNANLTGPTTNSGNFWFTNSFVYFTNSFNFVSIINGQITATAPTFLQEALNLNQANTSHASLIIVPPVGSIYEAIHGQNVTGNHADTLAWEGPSGLYNTELSGEDGSWIVQKPRETVQYVTANYSVSNAMRNVIVSNNTGTITVTLPSSLQDGSDPWRNTSKIFTNNSLAYQVQNACTGSAIVSVACSGKTFFLPDGTSQSSPVTVPTGLAWKFYTDGTNVYAAGSPGIAAGSGVTLSTGSGNITIAATNTPIVTTNNIGNYLVPGANITITPLGGGSNSIASTGGTGAGFAFNSAQFAGTAASTNLVAGVTLTNANMTGPTTNSGSLWVTNGQIIASNATGYVIANGTNGTITSSGTVSLGAGKVTTDSSGNLTANSITTSSASAVSLIGVAGLTTSGPFTAASGSTFAGNATFTNVSLADTNSGGFTQINSNSVVLQGTNNVAPIAMTNGVGAFPSNLFVAAGVTAANVTNSGSLLNAGTGYFNSLQVTNATWTNLFVATNGANVITQYISAGANITITQNGPTNIITGAASGGSAQTLSSQFQTNAGITAIKSGVLTTNLTDGGTINAQGLTVTNFGARPLITVTNSGGSGLMDSTGFSFFDDTNSSYILSTNGYLLLSGQIGSENNIGNGMWSLNWDADGSLNITNQTGVNAMHFDRGSGNITSKAGAFTFTSTTTGANAMILTPPSGITSPTLAVYGSNGQPAILATGDYSGSNTTVKASTVTVTNSSGKISLTSGAGNFSAGLTNNGGDSFGSGNFTIDTSGNVIAASGALQQFGTVQALNGFVANSGTSNYLSKIGCDVISNTGPIYCSSIVAVSSSAASSIGSAGFSVAGPFNANSGASISSGGGPYALNVTTGNSFIKTNLNVGGILQVSNAVTAMSGLNASGGNITNASLTSGNIVGTTTGGAELDVSLGANLSIVGGVLTVTPSGGSIANNGGMATNLTLYGDYATNNGGYYVPSVGAIIDASGNILTPSININSGLVTINGGSGLTVNTTSLLQGNATVTTGNTLNSQGPFQTGIGGTAPTAITFGANPATFNCPAGKNVSVYIEGGTLLAGISLNGVTITGTVSTGVLTVNMAPGDAIVVTYSVVPTGYYRQW